MYMQGPGVPSPTLQTKTKIKTGESPQVPCLAIHSILANPSWLSDFSIVREEAMKT
jgi:hypothetical protein